MQLHAGGAVGARRRRSPPAAVAAAQALALPGERPARPVVPPRPYAAETVSLSSTSPLVDLVGRPAERSSSAAISAWISSTHAK